MSPSLRVFQFLALFFRVPLFFPRFFLVGPSFTFESFPFLIWPGLFYNCFWSPSTFLPFFNVSLFFLFIGFRKFPQYFGQPSRFLLPCPPLPYPPPLIAWKTRAVFFTPPSQAYGFLLFLVFQTFCSEVDLPHRITFFISPPSFYRQASRISLFFIPLDSL